MFRLFAWLKPTVAPPLSHVRFCIKHQFSPSIWPSFCIKTLNSVNGPSSCLTRVSPYSSYPNLPNSQQKMEVFLDPTHPPHQFFPFLFPLTREDFKAAFSSSPVVLSNLFYQVLLLLFTGMVEFCWIFLPLRLLSGKFSFLSYCFYTIQGLD